MTWTTKKLGDLTSKIGSGATPRGGGSVYCDSGTTFIRSQNVLDHRMKTNDIAHIEDAAAESLRGVTVQPQDVLINITGDSIARCCVVDTAVLPARVNQHVSIIRTTAELDARYLQRYLVNPPFKESLLSMSAGGTRNALTKSDLANLDITFPSLAEQQAIAEVLGALDDKIAANTKLAETIEQLGCTKLSKLGINEEPGGDAVFLEAYFDFNPRRTAVSDEAVLIDMQALPTSQPLVSRWGKGPKRGGTRFMNGDTLLARITPCLENRKTGFVDFLSDGEVGIGSTEFIVIRSRGGIPLGASYFVATSSRFRDFAIQNMVGTSGRQRVSAADIARFELDPIALPDLVEFGEWADTNLKVLGSLRDENRTLAATRDALLPQLMSGNLRVRDIENTMGEMV